MTQSIRKISEYLNSGNSVPKLELDTTYDAKIVPLGHFRLRIVELVYHLLKLKSKAISDALLESDLFSKISVLVETFPWNNFLQLKVIALYEEIFENGSAEFKQQALAKSQIINTLIRLEGIKRFEHSSTRKIRHGHMAIVIRIGNLIQKNKEKDGVKEYLASLNDQQLWKQFVEGELLKSNETNSKNLGGQQPRNPIDDDDNDKDYEMDMEKIMAKFSNFNSNMSQKESQSSSQEEEDEEEIKRNEEIEEDEEPKQESPQKHEQQNQDESGILDSPLRTTKVDLPQEQPLSKEYVDNNYWQVNLYDSFKVDDLLADYE